MVHASTLTWKMILFYFFKKKLLKNLRILFIYHDIVIGGVKIIQIMMVFHTSASYFFYENWVSLF
jgi:hypothetical protein